MILSRRAIEKEIVRIVQDASSEVLPRIRQRINDTIAEITGDHVWKHLRATTTFQTIAAITKGSVTMTRGSKSIIYVSGSTSPSSRGRKIVIDGDNNAYVVSTVSSGTHLIANRPRDNASISTKGLTIFQDVYRVPTVVDFIEDVVNLTDPVDEDGKLDYMTRREMDTKNPSTGLVGTPDTYMWEDDTVTTYGSGTTSGSLSRGSVVISSAGLVAAGIEDGMAVYIGSTVRTVKSIGSSGTFYQTYEPAPEGFSAVSAWGIEKRLKNVRFHPAPEAIKTYMVRYYRREFGLHRHSDFWKADGKWHRLIIDGAAAKLLSEFGKEKEAAVYQRRFEVGISQMRGDNNKSPDESERQMQADVVGYRDTWK